MKYTTLVVKLPPIYTRIWPFYCVRAHQPGSCRVGSQKLFYEHPASGNALLYISLSSVVLIASFTSSAILNDRFAICNSRLLPTNQIVNCDGRVRPGGRTLFFYASSFSARSIRYPTPTWVWIRCGASGHRSSFLRRDAM